jgi:YfiR/HmsC-like
MKKLILIGLFVSIAQGASAQTEKPMHEIHAQMMYNFIKYIQWPDEAGDFVVGIFGEDDVLHTMKTNYDGKSVRTRKYVIKKITSPAEAAECTVVYIGKNKSGQFDGVKQAIGTKSILTITDSSNLGKKGSCINFKVIDGKLKFELNQESVAAGSLKVASQLSSMAIVL